MDKVITIQEKNVQDALSVISGNPNLTFSAKQVMTKAILTLCGIQPKIYKPGTVVDLVRHVDEVHDRYLICVTAQAQNYRGVRFCSMTTGLRAGDSYKPYQLPYNVEGLTADEIENYLGSQYKVVS